MKAHENYDPDAFDWPEPNRAPESDHTHVPLDVVDVLLSINDRLAELAHHADYIGTAIDRLDETLGKIADKAGF